MKLTNLVLVALSAAVGGLAASTTDVKTLESCHLHDLTQYCTAKPSGKEVAVVTVKDTSVKLPTEYTDCHAHGDEVFCVADGKDVLIEGLSAAATTEDEHTEDAHTDETDADHAGETAEEHAAHADEEEETSKGSCHYHAGVEHCTGAAAEAIKTCNRPDREYNIPLRIGSIFIVLATSTLSVFAPIFLRRFGQGSNISRLAFTGIKQFGTGVIIATAFVHLLTHATLLFGSDCVGELKYEATTTAIAMAGIFVSFIVEYVGSRYVLHRQDVKKREIEVMAAEKEDGAGSGSDEEAVHPAGDHDCTTEDKLSVFVMEMGIIFHSILIGITLVVAGDNGFKTLLVVIIFHQSFEGLALGARISSLAPLRKLNVTKILLGLAFALITPAGMAIGIGVRNRFNGNDKATLIAMGTLDAFSAGILVWVGVVEMWAHDWLNGELRKSGLWKTIFAMACLMGGMILMGVLGKWA